MQKNETYTAEIIDLTAEGNGVCRIDGMAVFVPDTAVGDVVEVQIVKVLKNYAFGRLCNLQKASSDRMMADCEYRTCGGCTFRHIHYEAEMALKQKMVTDAFVRLGKLNPEFLPILGGTSRCRYRNKAQYPVTADKAGNLVCGFYAKRSHRIVPVTDCLLQPELFRDICQEILAYAQKRKISAYREETGTGILRHIYIREGYHSKELMVCLVVRKSIERELKQLPQHLTEKFPQIRSIVMNINPHQTNVILGEKTVTLWGTDCITDTMCGNAIEISPLSFYQVNTPQAERLYGVAKDFAGLTGQERLLDLYCGAGTIGLSMADSVSELIGVEVIADAVENAKKNAARNGVENAEFICGDAGMIAVKLAKSGTLPDIIVADPPRKGCDEQTLQAMVDMHPSRIVMVSCNPSTAVRDCQWLSQNGYAVQKVQPVDLFPGTGHVECVVLMSKNHC